MAYQKLQGYSALALHVSSTVDIPDPSSLVMSGTTTATTANKLVMATGLFTTKGIQTNAIVYNTTDGTAAYVTNIDSDTTLSLSVDIMATGENFVIYNGATNGCAFYLGVSGDVEVETANSNTVTFKNLPVGFIPIQIKKLKALTNGAAEVIGIW